MTKMVVDDYSGDNNNENNSKQQQQLLSIVSMVLVGMLWGCTNPLLRKGAVETTTTTTTNNTRKKASSDDNNKTESSSSFLTSTLSIFFNMKVWLPYILNQSGSIVFYILLSNSDLSVAVPVCNALALVFSLLTGTLIGEPIQKPFRVFVGAALVLIGTTICISSSSSSD